MMGVVSLPRVIGKQVYGSLYECDTTVLGEQKVLEQIVRKAAEEGNMTLLDVKAWKIGDGVSIVAIVLESHITIHTWPEYNFATVDVYSCGSHTDPRKAFLYIVKELKARRYTMNEADRSSEF
ncbi:adenosylmethionine decarboxylase [Sulfolobus acidocaldarius]|uniref:S-adenosylmethionine decarboxylase proenzyme n=4 Tax=Sulfolobus acidocaldarius TaxID=2285 RepID=SPEH_SULAC|nr:adenosylmethionine decarboxylase [Sulfolobus acidocaldarius]Q4J8J9.1 RecName: Full=S-adenosylmethionine decarboxylase proenzyme; Short=AdoMetDC; Short=SAMDC; Contains: RecName: Full=S-adenosylmethionine decarboxylase beta chain; Contains: RecName: Full=S-adenosylmethionine decarboxylase alpha chain; Flags: Precursor [Sulfolobus acidocaldarius DSM 639]AAY80881.1 S-adenosylmethionine decarboxylase proenzyme [Sulfolobus acidocaldarius DSM 639]AHC51785.1 S-adenosylmethionine decarboxylase [Sulfol